MSKALGCPQEIGGECIRLGVVRESTPRGRSGGRGLTHQLCSLLAGGLGDWPKTLKPTSSRAWWGSGPTGDGCWEALTAIARDWVMSSWPSGVREPVPLVRVSSAQATVQKPDGNRTGVVRLTEAYGLWGDRASDSHGVHASWEYRQTDTDFWMRLHT